MQKLTEFFTEGLVDRGVAETVGAEVETSFVDQDGDAISLEVSQNILRTLVSGGRWNVSARKGEIVAQIVDTMGNVMSYELGRQNLEVATVPQSDLCVVPSVQTLLHELYDAAKTHGAVPHFEPILDTRHDLLVVPDKRDETWIALDGRTSLAELAKISSVQFTLSVSSKTAMSVINSLAENVDSFLSDYPQDAVWREYIRSSAASYRPDRYGGVRTYEDVYAYVQALSQHGVVRGDHLVPWGEVGEVDIPLHIRSVWWHFRLKRYDSVLCVEVRPLARRQDRLLEGQLSHVLETVHSFFPAI